jgi:hypothetical protein
LFGGGYSNAHSNVIDYVTIASTGNATDFGDLTLARTSMAGTSGNIKALFLGGSFPSYKSNVIDYVTMATTGNALDFGVLTSEREGNSALSSSHGGLQ